MDHLEISHGGHLGFGSHSVFCHVLDSVCSKYMGAPIKKGSRSKTYKLIAAIHCIGGSISSKRRPFLDLIESAVVLVS